MHSAAALGLHLSARLEGLKALPGLGSTLGGGAPPPPPNLAATADSATAVVAAAKAELPDFPSPDGLQRSLPAIPRLVPRGVMLGCCSCARASKRPTN